MNELRIVSVKEALSLLTTHKSITRAEANLCHTVINEPDRTKAAVVEALRQAAADWSADYERITAEVGSFGQMEVRAALRLASTLAERRADEIRDGVPHRWFGSQL
jgi:hypothetical protein